METLLQPKYTLEDSVGRLNIGIKDILYLGSDGEIGLYFERDSQAFQIPVAALKYAISDAHFSLPCEFLEYDHDKKLKDSPPVLDADGLISLKFKYDYLKDDSEKPLILPRAIETMGLIIWREDVQYVIDKLNGKIPAMSELDFSIWWRAGKKFEIDSKQKIDVMEFLWESKFLKNQPVQKCKKIRAEIGYQGERIDYLFKHDKVGIIGTLVDRLPKATFRLNSLARPNRK